MLHDTKLVHGSTVQYHNVFGVTTTSEFTSATTVVRTIRREVVLELQWFREQQNLWFS